MYLHFINLGLKFPIEKPFKRLNIYYVPIQDSTWTLNKSITIGIFFAESYKTVYISRSTWTDECRLRDSWYYFRWKHCQLMQMVCWRWIPWLIVWGLSLELTVHTWPAGPKTLSI